MLFGMVGVVGMIGNCGVYVVLCIVCGLKVYCYCVVLSKVVG